MHAEASSRGHTNLYVGVGVASLVLTALAFGLVLTNNTLKPHAVPIILVLALIQVALQTFLFMHLREGRRVYKLFFGYGVVLALIVVWGIPYVLTSYTPPSAAPQHLTQAQMVAMGEKIVTTTCISCHMVNGTGAPGPGPNLNKVLAGQLNVVPGGHPTQNTWLLEWIADPQSVWSSALMPDLGLTPQQVQAVVDYLQTDVK